MPSSRRLCDCSAAFRTIERNTPLLALPGSGTPEGIDTRLARFLGASAGKLSIANAGLEPAGSALPPQVVAGEELRLLSRWLSRNNTPHRAFTDGVQVALLVADGHEDIVVVEERSDGPSLESLVANANACGLKVRQLSTHLLDDSIPSSTNFVEAYPLASFVHAAASAELQRHARMCVEAFTDTAASQFVFTEGTLAGTTVDVADILAATVEQRRRVLVLGDFGSGKSLHLRRLSRFLAEAYLANGPGLEVSAPLFLRLEKQRPQLSSIVSANHLLIDGELLELLLSCGIVSLFFDGLDEMSHTGAPEEALRQLAEPAKASRTAVVVSSRASAFADRDRLVRLQGSVVDDLLDLQPFTNDQRDSFVEKVVSAEASRKQIHDLFRQTPGLGEMARRPVFLDLVVERRPWLMVADSRVTMPRLYREAVEDWLSSRNGLPIENVLTFAQAAARTLWESDRTELLTSEAAALSVSLLGEGAASFDELARQTRSRILVWSADQTHLRFGHRSFLEYFLANDLARRIASGNHDALAIRRLTPETRMMLVALDVWESVRPHVHALLQRDYRPKASENAALLLAAAGDSLPAGADLRNAQLADASFRGVSMHDADLRGADLARSDLRRSDLRRAQLEDADLSGCRLEDVRLDGAVLDSTCLNDSILDRATFCGATLRGASMLRARATGADFTRADLREADLSTTQWFDCHWSGAKLLGATATGAIWVPSDRPGTPQVPRIALSVRVPPPERPRFIHAVRWSPDGASLATAGPGTQIWIWDASTGQRTAQIASHTGTVWAVAWSFDSTRVVSASSDGTVRVSNASTTAESPRPNVRMRRATRVAWSPDADACATPTVGPDGSNRVLIWNASSGDFVKEFPANAANFSGFAWGLGDRLACGAKGFIGTRSPGGQQRWRLSAA